MIDPINLTDFNRNDDQLEELLLFSVLVAGKNALTTAKNLDIFLNLCQSKHHFACLREFARSELTELIKISSFGCYNHKGRAVHELVQSGINVRTCSIEDLEGIYGIGAKTARMYLLHSRPNLKVAVLDTHILKFMRESGEIVPKSTPAGKKYKEIEAKFLILAEKSGKSVAEFDLFLWNKYRKN